MARIFSERAIVALVLLVIGAGLLSTTFGRQYADLGGAFSPMFFPRIVLGAWVLLALANLVAEMVRDAGPKPIELVRVVILAIASVIFLVAMTRLGFFLSAVAFSSFALVLLGLRKPLSILVVAVGVPGALVALFNHALTLPLPTSPFTWWF